MSCAGELEEVLTRHGGRLDSIGHPTTTMEDYFLHIVEESKAHPGRPLPSPRQRGKSRPAGAPDDQDKSASAAPAEAITGSALRGFRLSFTENPTITDACCSGLLNASLLHYSDFGDGVFHLDHGRRPPCAAVFLLALWLAFALYAVAASRTSRCPTRWQVGLRLSSAAFFPRFRGCPVQPLSRPVTPPGGANPPPDTGQESLPLTTSS